MCLPTSHPYSGCSFCLEVKPFSPLVISRGQQRGETAEGGVRCIPWKDGAPCAYGVCTDVRCGGLQLRNIPKASLVFQCAGKAAKTVGIKCSVIRNKNYLLQSFR